jgi:Tol biopolymer transport system component
VTNGERESLSPAVSISPDGTKLYYARVVQNVYVWMMKDLPSGNEKELLRNPELVVSTLSPDGRYLAFGVRAQSKPRTLFILPTTGGELRELTHETELGQIRGLGWAADGSAMYILKAGELWRVPVDGSEPKKVDAPWAAGNFQTGPFKVHPDGRRIVFQAMTVRKPAEVWVLENFLPLPNAGK